jgi:NADH:ubiquinone oxidoreductase subunit F (NADH-binding)
MLVTVDGAVRWPGVYEIELGTGAGAVVTLAGGPAEDLQALLIGGYFGAWLPVEMAWQVPLTQSGMRAVGGALGAGIVVALPASSCGIAETARVMRYLAEQGAGQCGPCLMGLPALAGAVADLAFQGGRGSAVDAIAALLPLIERRGACRHPDGATQLARSAMRAFIADARWHDHCGPCDGVRHAPLLPIPGDGEEDRDWT